MSQVVCISILLKLENYLWIIIKVIVFQFEKSFAHEIRFMMLNENGQTKTKVIKSLLAGKGQISTYGHQKFLHFFDGTFQFHLCTIFGVFNGDQHMQFIGQMFPIWFSPIGILLQTKQMTILKRFQKICNKNTFQIIGIRQFSLYGNFQNFYFLWIIQPQLRVYSIRLFSSYADTRDEKYKVYMQHGMTHVKIAQMSHLYTVRLHANHICVVSYMNMYISYTYSYIHI